MKTLFLAIAFIISIPFFNNNEITQQNNLLSGRITIKDSSNNPMVIYDAEGNSYDSFPFSGNYVSVYVESRSYYRINAMIDTWGSCSTGCNSFRIYLTLPNNPDFYQNFGLSNFATGAILRSTLPINSDRYNLNFYLFR